MKVRIFYGSQPHEQFVGDIYDVNNGQPIYNAEFIPTGGWVRMHFHDGKPALMNLNLARIVQEA